jgi:predicted nucleotidyltransferase
MIDLNKISEILNLPKEDIHNIYVYGSRVYGTFNENSDIDYILICNQDELKKDYHNIDSNIQITSYNIEGFLIGMEKHDISILECLFLEDKFKIENMKFRLEINLSKLRESISGIISNSYVKAKKKIFDDEIYIGQKSLFHCFRICYYGTQIAIHKQIIDYLGKDFSKDYLSFKEFFNEIITIDDWEILSNKYKPLLNHNLTEFRVVAPKI